MVDRINLILKAKNLTSRQFAEEIGIQPSGMSHILSGRNRPSLDFVMKVINRYPEIDIKWLTLGEGEMYASPYSMPVSDATLSPSFSPSKPTTPTTTAPVAPTPMTTAPVAPTPTTTAPVASTPMTTVPVASSPTDYSSPKSAESQWQEPDLFSSAETPDVYTPNRETPMPSRGGAVDGADNAAAPAVDAVAKGTADVAASGRTIEAPAEPEPVPQPRPQAYQPQTRARLDENRVDDMPAPPVTEKQNLKNKKIVKVVILYDDHSFSEYYPE